VRGLPSIARRAESFAILTRLKAACRYIERSLQPWPDGTPGAQVPLQADENEGFCRARTPTPHPDHARPAAMTGSRRGCATGRLDGRRRA